MAKYTDEFRANCVLMLEAAGYRDYPTAAARRVSKSQRVPTSTLRSWWNRLHESAQKQPNHGSVPAKVYTEKKNSLRDMLRAEIDSILSDMPNARLDADYRDMAWALGVLFDKMQLLDNKPTAIVKLRQAVETGQITREQVLERYPSLAQEFFADAD